MDTHLEYPYKPKAKVMLLAAGGFALCCAVLFNVAMTNDRGLILWHMIHLDVGQATIFYWVLAAFSAGFVIMAALSLLENILSTEPPVLKLTPDEAVIPPYLFRREPKHVLWRELTRVTHQKVQGQEFLTLHYGDRQKAQITRNWLPDAAAWDSVYVFVMGHAAAIVPR